MTRAYIVTLKAGRRSRAGATLSHYTNGNIGPKTWLRRWGRIHATETLLTSTEPKFAGEITD